MELVKEFGDPRMLTLAEDHIVLKLATAWPRDMALPEGFSTENGDAFLLVANTDSLIHAVEKTQLREAEISKALFCACESFYPSNRYRNAAKSFIFWDRYRNAAVELLRDTREICIIHNTDKVYNLIRMFPKARILALPHDLYLVHALELEEPCREPCAPLVEGCQLRELVGDSDFFRVANVRMSPKTVLALLGTCPNVRRIDSLFIAGCVMAAHGLPSSAHTPKATSFTHLTFLSRECLLGLPAPDGTIAVDVALAAKEFTSIKHLKVAVGSMKSFAEVAAFRNLRSLFITLSPVVRYSDVNSDLKDVLTSSPDLEELALETCGELMLLTLATFCPRIKRLALTDCKGSAVDTLVNEGTFPNLEFLKMSMLMQKAVLHSFLCAIRETLRTAWFCSAEQSAEFLEYCVRKGHSFPFVNLDNLTLATDQSLPAMKVEPRDLHDVVKGLPALRHLQTDSYDLRLFFENCVPRGQVSLSWVGCVYCKVNDPTVVKPEELVISGQVCESTRASDVD